MTKRVPVIRQMNEQECGVACLAMVLTCFGRRTRLVDARASCDSGRDGVSARALLTAARNYGLKADAFALKAEALGGFGTPAILHWNGNHFVVLEKYTDKRVTVIDPAFGRRSLSHEEFRESFSGVILAFEPGPHFDKRADPPPSLWKDYLKRVSSISGIGRSFTQILAASVLLQCIGFSLAFFTKFLVDHVLPGQGSGLAIIGIGGGCVAIATALTSYCRSSLLIRLETTIDQNLMQGFFTHLLALPYRFFQQRSSGDLLMRLASNSSIRDALASYTISAILDGTLVLVFLAALLQIAPVFGLAALGLAVINMAILLGSSGHLNGLLETDLACQAESQGCLVESLMGIGTLKASGAEDLTLQKWLVLLAKQLKASAARNGFAAKIESWSGLIRTFAPLGLLWLGGLEVVEGKLSLGTMFAVNALAASFLQPVASLVMSTQRIQLARAYLERIADVMEAEREQQSNRTEGAGVLTGNIELSHVTFRYDAAVAPVLNDISLTIEAGQKVGIVGRTGSGKSTLAKLLLGLYEPTSGEIYFDGHPLRTLSYSTVRQQWGAVMQDAFVFSASVRENISFHIGAITMPSVVRAAQLAEFHNDIVSMPMGYETRIGESGNSLSGGQRQRLAIARALAPNPRMLLLDEATSQLDVLTERKIDQNLNSLRCTRVVVAHRLSTVRNADLIVVMCDGKVVEQGTHETLMAEHGEYAKLVENQSAELPSLCEHAA